MSLTFLILTIVFIVVAAALVLIVLVQRPQGGGLAGAFGGAAGGSTDTVFGGRVGDALTLMTVFAFLAYLGLAIGLNMVPIRPTTAEVQPSDGPVITTTNEAGETVTLPLEPSGPPPGFDPATNTVTDPNGQPVNIVPAPPSEQLPTDQPPAVQPQADQPPVVVPPPPSDPPTTPTNP